MQRKIDTLKEKINLAIELFDEVNISRHYRRVEKNGISFSESYHPYEPNKIIDEKSIKAEVKSKISLNKESNWLN